MRHSYFYPIGTPGQAWGAAERDQWRARQVRQRSYADDVLARIDRLRQRFENWPRKSEQTFKWKLWARGSTGIGWV